MRDVVALTVLGALLGAVLTAWSIVLSAPHEAPPKPVRHAYWPFTVEVEVWDVGASPWDRTDRPTDLDRE